LTVADDRVTGYFTVNDHIGGCTRTVMINWVSSHWHVKLVQVYNTFTVIDSSYVLFTLMFDINSMMKLENT